MKSKKQQRLAAKGKHSQKSQSLPLLKTDEEGALLSLELEDELECASPDGSNVLVLAGSKKRRRGDAIQKEEPQVLSKRQKRKLRRLQEEKQAREKREAVLASLEQHRLSDDQQRLLQSTGTIGQAETLKQKLHKAMQFQKAGLEAPPDSRLFRERKTHDESEGDQELAEKVVAERYGGDGFTAKAGGETSGLLLSGIVSNEKGDGNARGDSGSEEEKRTRKRGKTKSKLRIGGCDDDVMDDELEARRRSGAAAGPVSVSSGGVEKPGLVRGGLTEPGKTQRPNQGLAEELGKPGKKRKKVLERSGVNGVVADWGTVTEIEKGSERVGRETGSVSKARTKTGGTLDGLESGGKDSTKKAGKKKRKRGAEKEKVVPAGEAPQSAGGPKLSDETPVSDASLNGTGIQQAENGVLETHANGLNLLGGTALGSVRGEGKPFVRTVHRDPDVQEARSGLPILGMEQEIMEAVGENDLVVICGETGCGKTTQVPQFLFEAGYGSKECGAHPGTVGVTQPRRVAALATARRVAEELGVALGTEVGFQVRYDRRVGGDCAIKFMTDGILLREVQSDFLLRQYSCIIIDEAHERSLNTDVLIGLLSRIVPLRRQLSLERPDVRPLKLIIMSATLRIEDFVGNARLSPTPPPVVKVAARQFPVTVHFSKQTELVDYVGAAEKKVRAIHKQLPPGGVLVFLTGQREVEDLCKRLRRAFPVRRPKPANPAKTPNSTETLNPAKTPNPAKSGGKASSSGGNGARTGNGKGASNESEEKKPNGGVLDADVIGEAADGDDVADGLGFGRDEMDGDGVGVNGDGSGEDEADISGLGENSHSADPLVQKGEAGKVNGHRGGSENEGDSSDSDQNSDDDSDRPGPLHVLPLYAMLPAAAQLLVFGDPPAGHRLVVVATNVAETSLTIPGVRYVVDCGRAKERAFDRGSGLSRFEVNWISKASADQRAGRAGRTGPGHCYRLYSSAVFNDQFPQHAPPEIESAPIEGVVLQMKAMGIEKVVNFPFPTPPDRSALSVAERTLVSLAALTPKSATITPLGRSMAAYPISPRHARMLLAALTAGGVTAGGTARKAPRLLAHAIAAAAALSSESPFLREGFEGASGNAGGGEAGLGTGKAGLGAGEPGLGDGNVVLDDGRAGPKGDYTREFSGDDDWGNGADQKCAEKATKKAADEAKDAQHRRRAVARRAHARFMVPGSEALSAAAALRAYEEAVGAAGESVAKTGPSAGERFCYEHHLHARTMKEMAQLRQQLTRLVGANLARLDEADPTDSSPRADTENPVTGSQSPVTNKRNPSLNRQALERQKVAFLEGALKEPLGRGDEAKLRRAVCAGWADRVARKLRPGESVPGETEEEKSRRAVRYQACSAQGVVFLHPGSVMAKSAPDFVCYADLVRTEKRTYMQGVTAIDVRWLPVEASALCQLSKPLADPPPWYDPPGDRIMCWVQPTFGPHQWTLPLHPTELPPGKAKTAAFAVALLQGRVLQSLEVLAGSLTGPPTDILKPEAAGQKRVGELLPRLGGAGLAVDSRGGLRKRWAVEPRFLYDELALWVQAEKRGVLAGVWDRLLREAEADV